MSIKLNIVTGLPITLFVAFLVLKLNHVINWPWIWITSPIWITVTLCVIIFLSALLLYLGIYMFWIIVIFCSYLLNFYFSKIIIQILAGAAIGYICICIITIFRNIHVWGN
jgi:hypothetical protein